MVFKKLTWRDNVTNFGKTKGHFEILSDVKELNLNYSITNYNVDRVIKSDVYYLFLSDDIKSIESDSLDVLKLKAQEHFEKKVVNTFFEEYE